MKPDYADILTGLWIAVLIFIAGTDTELVDKIVECFGLRP